MPRIDLTTLIRDLSLEPVPVAATIKVQARDAHGPYVSVDGEKVIFSRQREIVLRPGQLQQIDVPPTDGAHFCWLSVAVGPVEKEWTLSVPDTTEVVPFGELVKVNPETYQPTEDVLAEWDILRQDSYQARADSVAAAGVAEGHARAAAGSEGAAAGSAGSAASSAGEAAGSAGSAAESAGSAAGSAGAAAGSAGEASGAAGRASDSAVAAAESERKSGLSADAAAGSAGTASTKAGEASTSAGQAGQAKTAAEAARDLALAGQFAGSDLGGSNTSLDTMLTPGVFYQTRAAQATVANKYPSAGLKGVLIVTRATGAFSEQLYIGEGGFGYYIRTGTSTAWNPWAFIPTQSMDVTVGRRMFARDDYNNRYQMIFGDTGARDITALASTDWTPGTMYLRRFGSQVELVGNMNSVGGAAVPANTVILTLPTGFRPAAVINKLMAGGSVVHGVIVGTDGTLRTDSGLTALRWGLTWTTSNAWPAALPGTAFGSIPVN